MINDITALSDERTAELAAEKKSAGDTDAYAG